MNLIVNPYPGYEDHVNAQLGIGEVKMSMEETQKRILGYTKKDDTEMLDRTIPGPDEGQDIKIRIITPADAPKPSPVVVDFHGGGWVSGSMDIDNYRNIALAEGTPCIVVAVEYRLTDDEISFPAPLMDCHAAYLWVTEHAAEFGGDPARVAIHGTSSGGNLACGLALYLRDRNEQMPKLTILNCPVLNEGNSTVSRMQLGPLGEVNTPYAKVVEHRYAGANGQAPSYYALPSFCPDLSGLGPMDIIVAEYDPLRSDGLDFAARLLAEGVPTEFMVAPRVTHGFCVIDQPLTRYVHRGICGSLRREFGMPIVEL